MTMYDPDNPQHQRYREAARRAGDRAMEKLTKRSSTPDNFSGFMIIICNKWIDEAKNWRCVLEEGHKGPCTHIYPKEYTS